MATIIALNNQNLLDIAIRYCGTVESVVDIAVLNGIGIMDDLIAGQLLIIPARDYGYQEIVTFFNENKKQPATALTAENKAIIEQEAGIGFWILGDNFIIQ